MSCNSRVSPLLLNRHNSWALSAPSRVIWKVYRHTWFDDNKMESALRHRSLNHRRAAGNLINADDVVRADPSMHVGKTAGELIFVFHELEYSYSIAME